MKRPCGGTRALLAPSRTLCYNLVADKGVQGHLEQANKQSLIEDYRVHATDSGSTEVQVALLTQRIRNLTEHAKANGKDHHSQRGLLVLIGQRRRLLNYLNRNDVQRYRTLINRLGLRK